MNEIRRCGMSANDTTLHPSCLVKIKKAITAILYIFYIIYFYFFFINKKSLKQKLKSSLHIRSLKLYVSDVQLLVLNYKNA